MTSIFPVILQLISIVISLAFFAAIVLALVLLIRYLVKKNKLTDLQLQEYKNKDEKPL
ncbi:hypothetical protein RBG61_10410 [Paludicola sp. MB14-C6]|uniref:hypothetical protein n=1 Tax=Paludihabitans sp. MB14-C6 TaxID=3070656 RepID=UPI0027DC0210|nr:hypothetical protein [Paludicola sp. MB14-C6]WMJ22398.1 hypothetical protein RBG61_10410 [Paludicola sp. MB14-C6]